MAGIINRIIFPAPAPRYSEKSFPELIWLAQGAPCLLFPQPRVAPFVVLYCHANAVDLGIIYDELRQIAADLGVHLLAVEYPGYGLAHGQASEDSVNASVDAAFNYLTTFHGVPPSNIVVFGRSIGTGPACRLAGSVERSGGQLEALVLLSPFASLSRLAARYLGPLGSIVAGFDNCAQLCSVTRTPVLFLHGDCDTVVPLQHGQDLCAACPTEHKYFQVMQGRGHNDIELEEILALVKQFMAVIPGNFATPLNGVRC